MTDEQRALAVGCAMAALERAHQHLDRVKDGPQGHLTKARQQASLTQTEIGVEIMRRIA